MRTPVSACAAVAARASRGAAIGNTSAASNARASAARRGERAEPRECRALGRAAALTPATRRMRGLRIRTSVSAAGRGARPAQTRAPGAHGVAKLRQLRSACRRPITQARIAARQGADAGTELGPQAADTLGESQRAFV